MMNAFGYSDHRKYHLYRKETDMRKGFDSLNESSELEDDMLDKAWGLEPESRLGCQATVADSDLLVEIPRYTINHARE